MDSPAQSQNDLQQNNLQNQPTTNTAGKSDLPQADTSGDQKKASVDLPAIDQSSLVSGSSKESAPIINQTASQENNEVQLSENEPVLEPEVKDAGVAAIPNPDHIKLESDVANAGVAPVKTAVPVQVEPSDKIQLPMTEEEANKAVKTHSAVDAAYGFGIEILKYFKKIHKGLLNK